MKSLFKRKQNHSDSNSLSKEYTEDKTIIPYKESAECISSHFPNVVPYTPTYSVEKTYQEIENQKNDPIDLINNFISNMLITSQDIDHSKAFDEDLFKMLTNEKQQNIMNSLSNYIESIISHLHIEKIKKHKNNDQWFSVYIHKLNLHFCFHTRHVDSFAIILSINNEKSEYKPDFVIQFLSKDYPEFVRLIREKIFLNSFILKYNNNINEIKSQLMDKVAVRVSNYEFLTDEDDDFEDD